MTLLEAEHQIDMQWQAKTCKMDYQGMELLLVNILNMDAKDWEKVALCMDCINAFTRRGYFQSKSEDQL